ncbi:hypothetical protein J6590_002286 [Homalodisca vitripennis]|nr:hypothetical protein J6590_002286 [Homalodisca vitripennis]
MQRFIGEGIDPEGSPLQQSDSSCELVPGTQFNDEVTDPDGGVPSRYTEVDNEKLKARTALAFAFYNSRVTQAVN